MTNLDSIFDLILGVFFWLALGIPILIFLTSAIARLLKRIWPQSDDGEHLNLDQVFWKFIYSLGSEARGPRTLDGTKTMRVTMGLRGAVLAMFAFSIVYFFHEQQTADTSSLYITLGMIALIFYYVVLSWTFSVRYDRDRLWVRGFAFVQKEYDLRKLESLTSSSNATWRLWFENGSSARILQYITQSKEFREDMRLHLARNVAN